MGDADVVHERDCDHGDRRQPERRSPPLERPVRTDEHEHLRAQIDTATFHAYGLDCEEMAFVLEDFHRMRNPRMMTEDYFERVLDEYEELANS